MHNSILRYRARGAGVAGQERMRRRDKGKESESERKGTREGGKQGMA